MNKFIENLKNITNETTTWNNAKSWKSSLNANVDLFYLNYRFFKPEELISKFALALQENEDLALANMLNLADIRTGKGERRVTKILLNEITQKYDFNEQLFEFLLHFSRADILINQAIQNKNINLLKYIKKSLCFETSQNEVSLLAKWMPTIETKGNKSKNLGRQFCKLTNWNETAYRKTISQLRNKIKIVEHQITTKNYDEIDYSKIPSLAFKKYTPLFFKYDRERFKNFIDDVNKGKIKLNAKVLYPYQVFEKFYSDFNYYTFNKEAIDLFIATWKNIKQIEIPENTNILPVCDFSASMTGLPMYNSKALGMYLAHHNKGAFQNILIEFNDECNFIQLTGDIANDLKILMKLNAVGSTNIDKVFKNILNTMVVTKNKDECPKYILIISDMQFNEAISGRTNYENWKEKFNAYGLELPKIIFWNVSCASNFPVLKDTKNVALISGFSTAVLDHLFDLKEITPEKIMLNELKNYQFFVQEIKKLRYN